MAKFTLKTLFPLGFSFSEPRGNGKRSTIIVLWGKYQGTWAWNSGSPNLHRKELYDLPPCKLHTKLPFGRPKHKPYKGHVIPQKIKDAVNVLTHIYNKNRTQDPETMALATIVRDYNKAFAQIPEWALEDAKYIMKMRKTPVEEQCIAFPGILTLLNWLGQGSRDYILSDYDALKMLIPLCNEYRWGKRMRMMKHLILQKRRAVALRNIFPQLKASAVNQLNRALGKDTLVCQHLVWYGHGNYRNDIPWLMKQIKLDDNFHDIRELGPNWVEPGMFDKTYKQTTDSELQWLDSLLNQHDPAAGQRNQQIVMFIKAIVNVLQYYWNRNKAGGYGRDSMPAPRLNRDQTVQYKAEMLSCKGSQSLRDLHDTLMHPYRRDIAAIDEWNKREVLKAQREQTWEQYTYLQGYKRTTWVRDQLGDISSGGFPSPLIQPNDAIKYISTREALVARGMDQEHCVGDYASDCERGHYYCYTVDYQGQTATLMINENGTFNQLYGKNNSLVSQGLLGMVNLWLKESPMLENEITRYRKIFEKQAEERFPILSKEKYEKDQAEKRKLDEKEEASSTWSTDEAIIPF